MTRKAILICIYGDTATTGFLGPIFADRTFEGIPIPIALSTGPTYQEIMGTHQVPISTYIPKKAKIEASHRVHFDPDPIHLTYGDKGNSLVAHACRKLKTGDLLLWAARLREYADGYKNTPPRVYLIGWLMVDRVIDGTAISKKDLGPLFLQRNINNHLLLACFDQSGNVLYDLDDFNYNLKTHKHVVVSGKKDFGGQLATAVPLTDPLSGGSYPINANMTYLFSTANNILRIGPYNLDYERAFNLVKKKPLNNPKLPLKWM